MSIKRQNLNLENKIKKNIMPITITSNINPNNYVFVNKNNQIASLYLKMGQKMQLKKHNNTKSCSYLQYSDESSKKNNISNNSFQLSNFSMTKNIKTNNISGYRTNREQSNAQKISNRQDYIIHVNLNYNHKSSLSNYILNNKISDNNNKFKFNKNNNKQSLISLNNSELYNSINCLSTRNKFYRKKKEDKSDLKKNKNNMKTKKFKFPFNERKKNKYISTSFCNLNINNNNRNINRTMQKSEDKILTNNLSQNKIISNINNEKKTHFRYSTMFIDEKNIKEIIQNKNKILKQYSNKTSIIKHNNSTLSMNNNVDTKKCENTSLNIKNNKNSNNHIKNSLSSYGNKKNNINNLITKEKNEIKKNNKKIYNNKTHININKIKKNNNQNNNQIIERKVKINRKDLLREIKIKINNKKNNELKIKPKKIEKNTRNEKMKEFSKIMVLDDYKYKKTSINFYNKAINNNGIDNLIKTKREVPPKCNLIMNNSKSKESIQIEKNKSFKTKQINNKNIINNSLEEQNTKNLKKDKNIKDNNIIDNSTRFNNTYFPFPLSNPNKNNYKKPLIKITHNNISFNKNIFDKDKEPSNSSIINNSDLISINQKSLLLKDKNFIIKKKKSIGNNSFHINKKIIINNSIPKNNNKIIINNLFDNENIEILPDYYDEKFNDLYAIVHKINFGSVLIGAESLFSLNSHIYKEFQNNFDISFIKKYNKQNIDERKGKYLKKINNSFSTKTDFSSSNKNFYKNIYNNSGIPNEFEISEII